MKHYVWDLMMMVVMVTGVCDTSDNSLLTTDNHISPQALRGSHEMATAPIRLNATWNLTLDSRS